MEKEQIAVALARLEEKLEASNTRVEDKVDGINARLDKLNGSVARHEEKLGQHDLKFTELSTEKSMMATYLKPVLVYLFLLLGTVFGVKSMDLETIKSMFGG